MKTALLLTALISIAALSTGCASVGAGLQTFGQGMAKGSNEEKAARPVNCTGQGYGSYTNVQCH